MRRGGYLLRAVTARTYMQRSSVGILPYSNAIHAFALVRVCLPKDLRNLTESSCPRRRLEPVGSMSSRLFLEVWSKRTLKIPRSILMGR